MSTDNPDPMTDAQVSDRITASVNRIGALVGQMVGALGSLPRAGEMIAIEELTRAELDELRSWLRIESGPTTAT